MWLTVGIVALVVAMMVGPIMMVRPTPGQRKLDTVRVTAQNKGMTVRMVSNPCGSDPKFRAMYSLPHLQSKKSSKRANWNLVKNGYSHEGHFHGQWDWGRSEPDSSQLKSWLLNELDSIDHLALAIESNPQGVGLVWSENVKIENCDKVVTEIFDFLEALRSKAAEGL